MNAKSLIKRSIKMKKKKTLKSVFSQHRQLCCFSYVMRIVTQVDLFVHILLNGKIVITGQKYFLRAIEWFGLKLFTESCGKCQICTTETQKNRT